MILVVDNYDSFVHNLARCIRLHGAATEVVRNDQLDFDALAAAPPQAIVLSPGPRTPDSSGQAVELVVRFGRRIPILGVCLGHQIIAQAYGGRIVAAPRPVHGQTSFVYHGRHELFQDIPSPFAACRYHSLIVDATDLAGELETIAWSEDHLIMAIAHRRDPVLGVQFHPEALLTEHGHQLIGNFLRMARSRRAVAAAPCSLASVSFPKSPISPSWGQTVQDDS